MATLPPDPQQYQSPFLPTAAILRLRREINNEATKCWMLIALCALALFPVGIYLIQFFMMLMGLLVEEITNSPYSGPLTETLTPIFAVGAAGVSLFALLGALALPAVYVSWAVLLHSRTKLLVTRDLVWGNMAHMLVNDHYALQLEEVRRSYYRPNINPVKLGEGFREKLHHFAYYYRQFYVMSYGPGELKPPNVVEGNCWAEGLLVACFGCGGLVSLPVAIRVLLIWPRVLAIKQAALDFLDGRHDGALEQQYETRRSG